MTTAFGDGTNLPLENTVVTGTNSCAASQLPMKLNGPTSLTRDVTRDGPIPLDRFELVQDRSIFAPRPELRSLLADRVGLR